MKFSQFENFVDFSQNVIYNIVKGGDYMNNLRKLRISKNMQQKELAAILNIKISTYCQYETGKRQPDYETLKRIANYFNVSTDYLLENDTLQNRKIGVKIPVYGHVAGGIPISAIEDILDYEEITEDEARKGEYFALQIKGHSMEPRIYDKDVVIVRRQSDVDNGDIAIVLIDGEEATCKKIKKTPEGVMLIPLNTDYETMFYSNKQIEDLPVTILGKVVECRSKFERI